MEQLNRLIKDVFIYFYSRHLISSNATIFRHPFRSMCDVFANVKNRNFLNISFTISKVHKLHSELF